ncbi:MAG: membrane dipeptidase, partial [Candidatus Latescibacterota bacterium]|nr:membrane dipeptidase [Candidatus Latescibacterota bacterium]
MRVVSQRARQFHQNHPICDMLGLNLNHPRFVLDDTDLTQRAEDHFRGDFPKFGDWGMNLVVAKGGVTLLTDEYRALWNLQPERRAKRDGESLFLTLAVPNATQTVLAELDRFLLNVEKAPDSVHLVRTVSDLDGSREAGKVALLMAANRADWFGDSPGVLRQFSRLGLRMITIGQATRELGWDPSSETRSGGRLTELGVRMIAEMNQCGI